MTTRQSEQGRLDGYLGLLQFFFLLGWIVYVIFLGDLLARAGLSSDMVPRVLLVDQIVFAGMDVLLGLYADRALNLLKRLTPLLLVLNLLACLIFASLPAIAGLGAGLLITATLLWVASSAVLRAPLYGVIARRAANPLHGTAWSLAGMGVASAAAPYLGIALKEIDPTLPFLLSAIALALTVLGFAAWEARQPFERREAPVSRPNLLAIRMPFLIMLFLGAGFQLHFFVNAAPLFKAVAEPAMLPWLMPVFWVGFSLAVYPGCRLLARQDAQRMLAVTALLGAGASLACASVPALGMMVGLQAVAGASWGIAFLAILELAGKSGQQGRESMFIGLVFAALAFATALRIGLVLGLPLPESDLRILAPMLWGVGALLAVYGVISSTRGGMRNESAQH